MLTKTQQYYQQHKERILKYTKEYQRKNPFKVRLSDNMQHFNKPREYFLKRDGYKCQICGIDEKLILHHKDGRGDNVSKSQKNNAEDNIITLCKSCHPRVHCDKKAKQKYPIAFSYNECEDTLRWIRNHWEEIIGK